MPQLGGYLSLVGGFLLHLTLGTLYCFGNMNTYMTSYLRTHVQGQVRAGGRRLANKLYVFNAPIMC